MLKGKILPGSGFMGVGRFGSLIINKYHLCNLAVFMSRHSFGMEQHAGRFMSG